MCHGEVVVGINGLCVLQAEQHINNHVYKHLIE